MPVEVDVEVGVVTEVFEVIVVAVDGWVVRVWLVVVVEVVDEVDTPLDVQAPVKTSITVTASHIYLRINA